jgi:flagellar motor switch protein FliG
MGAATASPRAGDSAGAAAMTPQQKLAALLIMMGPENAAKLLRDFDEQEVEALATHMAKLPMISHELQQEILREFSDVALHAATALRGGMDYVHNVLEKSIGMFKASDIMNRVSPSPSTTVSVMQQIIEMDARQVFNLVRNEQPQTIALIISYLNPDKASEVLFQMRQDVREQIIERLANIAPMPIEVVERLAALLTEKVGVKPTRALNQTGGVRAAAALLNAMDKNLSKSILVALEERKPELSQAIQRKMFTFDDLASLDPGTLQRIMREVDMRQLAVALKTASDAVRKALMGGISKRAAEAVMEEVNFMGPIKLRDIEAAQNSIIDIVRRLEAAGQVELGEAREESRRELLA